MLWLLDVLAKSNLNPQGDEGFVDATAAFISSCSALQIRIAPDIFVRLCRKFKEQVIALRCPRRGILPLKKAITALAPSPDCLTPMHGDLFQLCLMAKVYNAATDVLEADLYDVDPSKTCSTPTDLYLYAYYGGMLCIGRKSWARALELLMLALTAPSGAPNAIVLACYKKYVLASLIHLGSLPPLPKFTPGKVRSLVEGEGRPYTELATAYASHSAQKLARCVDGHSATYTQDGNGGLVKQVVSSLATRNIQRLTATYLTLPLADIAAHAGLASAGDAEAHVLRMIGAGDISAVISEAEGGEGGAGMVRFLEDGETWASGAVAARISAAISRCVGLAERVQGLHDTVSTDKDYLRKVGARERRFDAGVGGGASVDDYGGLAGVGGAQMFVPGGMV